MYIRILPTTSCMFMSTGGMCVVPAGLFQHCSIPELHYVTVDIYSNHHVSLINPRRACAARVTVVVLCTCLSVCLSVYDYSRTTGYEAAYERYQHPLCYKGMKKYVTILLKRLRSKSQYV